MKFFAVKNSYDYDYIVPTQEYVDLNKHIKCYVGDEQTAQQKLQENIQTFLTQNSYLFSINKETINGNDTTWSSVTDINSDEHTGCYYVFNPLNGVHTSVETKEQAKILFEQYKQNFLDNSAFSYFEINSLPSPFGGRDNGLIPIEVI